MSKPIITIQSNASVIEAMQVMNSKCIRRLLVTDSDNKMLGIITEERHFQGNKQESISHNQLHRSELSYCMSGSQQPSQGGVW